MLSIGVSRACIDPPLNLPHAGWGAQTHVFADGIDTHLYVTGLYATDGERAALVLDFDVCLFTPEQNEAIRAAAAQAAGLPRDAVRVITTHSHAGPMIEAGYYGVARGVQENYVEMLAHQAAGVAMTALRGAQPCLVAVGQGSCTFARNRRQKLADGRVVTGSDAAGFTDPTVTVARIDTVSGQPLAVVFSYTCHPTTLGPPNRLVSADYPGTAKELLLAATGATPVFVQGAAGNIGPGPEGFTGDVAVPHRLGRILGHEVAKVYEELRPRPVRFVWDRVVESGAPLGVFRTEEEDPPRQTLDVLSVPLALPVRPQPSVTEAEAASEAAAEHLRRLRETHAGPDEVADATYRAKRASMALERARRFGGGPTHTLELHLLRLGPLVLAGIPAEPFAEIGAAIKARSPYPHTVFGGYTNGWLGYIPIPEAYPDGGYEVDTTPYEPEAAQAVVAGTLAALEELRRREAKLG